MKEINGIIKASQILILPPPTKECTIELEEYRYPRCRPKTAKTEKKISFFLLPFLLLFILTLYSCKNNKNGNGSVENPIPAYYLMYKNIVQSLRAWEFYGKSVKLVPIMNRTVYDPEGNKTEFLDVYHIFPAAIVLSMMSANNDFAIAKEIAEFYLLLFENRQSHLELLDSAGRFNGFPEVYKDMSGNVNLSGDIQIDPGLTYRGSGPTAWLGKSMLNYLIALQQAEGDTQQGDRLLNLCEAIGEWLIRLQINNYYNPWLNGGITGALYEDSGEAALGPYTEGGSAAYAFFRTLASFEKQKGRLTQEQIFNEAADRLGEWFRWVIDGVNIRVYVGRNTDGTLVEGVPGEPAEAVDAYAFTIMAGIVDRDLAIQLIDRVKVSGAYTFMNDDHNRNLSGLKFGPQGDTIYWGPHGQVTTAAFWVNHSWASALLQDMVNAKVNERMTVFVRPLGYEDSDQVLDWTGQPGDYAWVGDLFCLETSAWLTMLRMGYYEILDPVTWEPVIKLGDPMLEIPNLKIAPDDDSLPTMPYANVFFVLDEDKEELSITKRGAKHNERSTLKVDVHSIVNKAVVVFQYNRIAIFPSTGYSFFIKNVTGISGFKIELKDKGGNIYWYDVDNLSEGIWHKITISGTPALNSVNISEILIHFEKNGILLIDGIKEH